MMEYSEKVFQKDWVKENYSSFILGIDIGGTNTNIGIAGVKEKKPTLLFSHHFDTRFLDSLVPCVNQTLEIAKTNYDIDVHVACVAVAGIVSSDHDSVDLTNASWKVSKEELLEKTALTSVDIINDFQAIGYGINLLNIDNNQDVFQIRSGSREKTKDHPIKVVIGAGTGLGKSILIYNENAQAYLPIPTEGGHVDLPIHDEDELALVEFIRNYRKIDEPLTYEEVLSGRGLEALYAFVRHHNKFSDTVYTHDIDDADEKAPLISEYKKMDETCDMTFRLFTRFYGRCAKNIVLDTLAAGGLYIAGGIAAKNKEIFISKEFLDEFDRAFRRSEFLREVPLFVILNYDISLLGACYAAVINML